MNIYKIALKGDHTMSGINDVASSGQARELYSNPQKWADSASQSPQQPDPEKEDYNKPKPSRPTMDRYEPGKRTEKTTGSTDKVDREIEALRKKRAELESRLARAANHPEEKLKLERELAKIEAELKTKDNDSYRRQHTVFS